MPTPADPMFSSLCPRPRSNAPAGWTLLGLLLVAACGTDASSGGEVVSTPDAAIDAVPEDTQTDSDADTTGVDTRAEVSPPADADDDSSDTPDVSQHDAGQHGAPCAVDSDCLDQFCANLVSGGRDGVCLARCQDDTNCASDEDCLLLSGSGGEARVCVPRNFCQDADADGFGEGPGCLGRDCDDANPLISPGIDERCNGYDDNCNGRIDENPVDATGACDTGFVGVCAAGTLRCDGGAVSCQQTVVASQEVCDGLDNDCDGRVDEDATDRQTWWPDSDGDGYGADGASVLACAAPSGHVARGGDCDDTSNRVYLGAPELCDLRDNDCDDVVDEEIVVVQFWPDRDGDGYGDP